jgi:hypothetical protein
MKATDLKNAIAKLDHEHATELEALTLGSQESQAAELSRICGRYGCPYPLPRRAEARAELLEMYPHTLAKELAAATKQMATKLDEKENEVMGKYRLKTRELLKKAGPKAAVDAGLEDMYDEFFAADHSQLPQDAKLFELVGGDS